MNRPFSINPLVGWPLLAVTLAACSSESAGDKALDGNNSSVAPGSKTDSGNDTTALPEDGQDDNDSDDSSVGDEGDDSDDGDAVINGPMATVSPTATNAATAAGVSPTQGAAGVPAPQDEAAIAEGETAPLEDDPAAPPRVNPFVETEEDPFSTFAVDVDTASYDIFRRDVLNGYLPTAETVRVEEFVNFFDYDYPAPEADSEQPFSISLAAAPSLFDTGTTLLRVGIQGEQAPEFEKKDANLVFLVDVSGSMQSPEKLPLVQSVLTQALNVLEPSDTVSVVTYASGTQVVLEPTPVSEKDEIAAVIEGLSAGGSTNGAGGIQLAYERAREAYIEGGINHVVLCTDGDFNVGVSDTDGLIELIEEERKSGVTFTALGFGAENNDAMMEAVSNAGNGMYGVIANEDQATEYVYDRLLHNLTLIAKDVKIQVEFNPELVTAYRLIGYENRAIADEDFRDDKVDAGEIGAEHRVTALYELVLAGAELSNLVAPPVEDAGPAEDAGAVAPAEDAGPAFSGELEVDPADLVLVKVRYKDVDATEQDPAYEVNRSLHPDDVAGEASELDADFQWAAAVATFAEVLRGSPFASQELLPAVKELVEPQANRDTERMEFNTLLDTAIDLLAKE